MNMKTRFEQLASRLINQTFGDVAQTVTVRRSIYENYDEITGAIVSYHNDIEVKGILGRWREDRQALLTQDAIQTDDVRLLIAGIDPEFLPRTNQDTIITSDGTVYTIVDSVQDAAQATVAYRLVKEQESE